MNQILYEGWIFFQNHRVVMHVGAGLHMSHTRQNLGTLGGFETSLRSKNVFLGAKKYILDTFMSATSDARKLRKVPFNSY